MKVAAIQRAEFHPCHDPHFRAITRQLLPIYFLSGIALRTHDPFHEVG